MGDVKSFEKKLIEGAIAGDENCFESLILSCKQKSYNIALRYVGNKEDALDILQESYIKIYKSLKSFKGDSRFDTWVYRIVINTAKDFLRKEEKNRHYSFNVQSTEESEIELKIEDSSPGPEERLIQSENGKIILQCLNKLKDEQKEILILRDIQNLSYDEIADVLGCSIGTVKSRISRGRSNLKDIYLKKIGTKP